jgi:argininosuccinate lyase
LQEDKERLFDTADTLVFTLDVFAGMVETLSFKPDKMLKALDQGYLLATDLADYLVKKGEPFRSAHEAVGKLVQWAGGRNKTFEEISLKEYQKFSSLFEKDVYSITLNSSLASRDNPGGTAPRRVKQELNSALKIAGLKPAKKR